MAALGASHSSDSLPTTVDQEWAVVRAILLTSFFADQGLETLLVLRFS